MCSGRLTSQLDWFFSSFIGVFHGVSPVSHHFPEAENNNDDDKGRRWRTWRGYGTSGPGMQGRGGHHHHRVRRGRNRFQGPCISRKGQPRPPKEWPLPSLTAGNGDLHWHPSKAYLVLRPNLRLGPKTIPLTVLLEAILARPLQVCFIFPSLIVAIKI